MKSQLPPRPNLEQLKKQAKMILKGHRTADPHTLTRIQRHHPRWHKASVAAIQGTHFTLSDAQLVIANEYGFETWSKLKGHVLLHQTDPSREEAVKALREAPGRGDLDRLAGLLDAHPDLLNARGGPGTRTALHSAVFGGQEAAVKFLLEHGADPGSQRLTRPHYAAKQPSLKSCSIVAQRSVCPLPSPCRGRATSTNCSAMIQHVSSRATAGALTTLRQASLSERAINECRVSATSSATWMSKRPRSTQGQIWR